MIKIILDVPNDLYWKAEKVRKRLRISRSEAYKRAMVDLLGQYPEFRASSTRAVKRRKKNIAR